ncbi:PH (Pleckstrin Homology) domain-containing protein [Brevibacterium sanguinis]|uniref:PH (Pleckstrin Homology) domain-containing protein n=2 Tax=Brevibacterium TaxID=1696 RepID=A0A366IH48_9MICO|nr:MULTISPECIES: PH domain-containing protein [Brevibacterium]RBP61600.1 PH (Pleckstrin Homology) domain-containing protein [Brevibacterium sanguinis]RBP70852.1 PH (Pleckstrin Homology) domain-containing protein [Brevibacterium celere]
MRIISLIGAVVVLLGFATLSVALLVVDWEPWKPVDMIWMNGLGIVFAAALWRLADIQARPSETGLVVRNMARTRFFAWGEILGVSFAPDGDDPWPLLDLADGTTWAVMAIQHADGPRAHEECRRLRMLIDEWTPSKED